MAGFKEYENYDAKGLAELVAKGEVTPDEVLEAAIERVEARNPAINAVVCTMYDEARQAIADGLPAGPFRGRALHDEGPGRLLQRRADDARQPPLPGLRARFRQHHRRAFARCRPSDHGQDQHA